VNSIIIDLQLLPLLLQTLLLELLVPLRVLVRKHRAAGRLLVSRT